MATMAERPKSQIGAPVLFNAKWGGVGNDEVAIGTSFGILISMRIMWKQWSVDVESTGSPYHCRPRRINGVVQMQPAVI